jgi:MFS family permease
MTRLARPSLTSDGLRAFRHRNYRLFYAGQTVSLIGTWMQQVAQAWLVLELTNDPFFLGLIAAAQFTPVLVLGLFGGVVADALPKRRTLVAVQATMMILALTLWALSATGLVQVWMIFVLALLLGTANAVDMPVRQSFVIEMVGRSDIANAVALNSAMFNGARIMGPAIAGLVIAAVGVPTAFFLNGLSFLAVIVGLLMIRESELVARGAFARPHSVREVGEALGEGLSYVRRTPAVLLAVWVVGLVATFGMNFSVVIPAFSRDVLGTGAEGYGFLMSLAGVGSLLAALWLAFGGRARIRVLIGGALVLGLAETALAFTSTYAVAGLLLFLVGAGGIAMAATANTTIQMAVPDELRGRVLGVYTTVFAGSTPIGGLIVGAIASVAGVPVAVLVGGVAATVVALAAALWVRMARLQPVSPVSPVPSASPLPAATAGIGAPVPVSAPGGEPSRR